MIENTNIEVEIKAKPFIKAQAGILDDLNIDDPELTEEEFEEMCNDNKLKGGTAP